MLSYFCLILFYSAVQESDRGWDMKTHLLAECYFLKLLKGKGSPVTGRDFGIENPGLTTGSPRARGSTERAARALWAPAPRAFAWEASHPAHSVSLPWSASAVRGKGQRME